MILMGDAKVCDLRKMLFEHGVICAFVPTDLVKRLFLGGSADADLLFGECVAADGTRFLLGRVRVHRDDKHHDSSDEKHKVMLAVGPKLAEELGESYEVMVQRALLVAGMFGIRPTAYEVNGDPDLFIRKLGEHGPAHGIETSFRFHNPETGEAISTQKPASN